MVEVQEIRVVSGVMRLKEVYWSVMMKILRDSMENVEIVKNSKDSGILVLFRYSGVTMMRMWRCRGQNRKRLAD
jgi:hypothetical protein